MIKNESEYCRWLEGEESRLRQELATVKAQRDALAEALRLHMRWVGAPPVGPYYFDSLREDAWEKGRAALATLEDE